MTLLVRARRWLAGLSLALLPMGAAQAQQPVIQRIYVTDDPTQDSVFQLGNTIALEVTGLNRWLKLQEALLLSQGFEPEKAHAKARNLVLYIDDAPIIGMPPLALYVDESAADKIMTATARRATQELIASADSAAPDNNSAATLALLLDEYPIGVPDKVVFKLRRDVSNYRYWNMVYQSPWVSSYTGKIGLGYEDRIFTKLHPGKDDTIRLKLIQPVTLWIAVLGTLALGLGLLALGARSWLLRVTVPGASYTTEGGPTVQAARPPFSLAKMQMAWWTFIILGSFLVIYCVSGDMPDISTTSLALLGISGGTTALNGLIRRPAPAPTTTGQWLTSRGWLTDILSDASGLSMNRLQQAVISLLMGYFFLRTVYNSVAMPVWTDNQVLLLAVSSATYLGLEWQGNRSADDPGSSGAVSAPATEAAVVAGPAAPAATTAPVATATEP